MRIAINKSKSKSKNAHDDTIKQVDEWIAAHQRSFISRALWNNIEEVMDTCVLSPEEMSYRKEFKSKPTAREKRVIDISQTVTDLKPTSVRWIVKEVFATNLLLEPLSRIVAEYAVQAICAGEEPLPMQRITLRNQLPISQAWRFGYCSEDRYRNLFEKLEQKTESDPLPTIKLKDRNQYQVICEPTGDKSFGFNTYYQLEGIPSLHDRGFFCIGEPQRIKKDELRKKYSAANLTEAAVETALDIVSEDPIDSKLAKVWKAATQLNPGGDRRREAKLLYDLRTYEIQHIDSFYLHAMYNIICWSSPPHSNIRILKGNPESIISHSTKAMSDFDRDRKLEDMPLKKDDTVILLMPWENGGELFSLDLTQDDTIVIGQRKELEPHVKRSVLFMFNQINNVLGGNSTLTRDVIFIVADYARHIRTFYLENMSEQQIDFFNVPNTLLPTFFQPESEDEDSVEGTTDTALVAEH